MIVLAAALLAIGVVVARLADRSVHAPAAPSALAAQPIPEPTNNSRSVTLSRGNGGHFWTDARVDGRRLEFVVDTGATQIALRASGSNLDHPPRDFIRSSRNGERRDPRRHGAASWSNRQYRGDVPALVHADGSLGVNLLGMSFLSRVRFTHDRGKLVLEQ
jgi:aspartyl protease family protein